MTITVPVETGEELTIEVLDQDPEIQCSARSCSMVAVFRVVAPAVPCGPHYACLRCGEHDRRLFEQLAHLLGPRPYPFVCYIHCRDFQCRPAEVLWLPLRGCCS